MATIDQIKKGLETLINEKNKLEKRIYLGEEMLREIREKNNRDFDRSVEERFNRDGVSNDCLKLLKRMEFEGIWYGQAVSIGVCGKRPFGNSDIDKDVANILGWEYEDELTELQIERRDSLFRELPLAINYIIANTTIKK